jgi:tetratricopeptide (TPR) repeat protein
LEAALQINPDDTRTLRGLVDVRIRRKEFDSAAEIASRWVRVESEPGRRAEGLALLGRVERTRGNLALAIQAYQQSVELAGLEGMAAAELVELLGQQRRVGHPVDYQGYVSALSSYAGQRSIVGPGEVRVYQEIGRVLDAELGQRERAIEILERVLVSAPHEVSLRSEVAQIQERAGNYGGAIESYRKVIQIDVTRADAYRGIARALENLGRTNEAAVALSPLVVLGAANDSEQQAVNARAAKPVLLDRSLELEEIIALGMPSTLDPTGAVLAAIADALDRIESPNLDQYGLVARDRIGSRSGHPLRTLADRIASLVGADEFEFYVSSNVANVCIEPGDPPCIIAPVALNQAPESVQVFAFARVLLMLARKWQAAERLDLSSLEGWVMSAVRLSEGGEETQTRRLAKALAWGRKGRVEEAAEAYVRAGNPAVLDFVQRARTGANRAAAVLADDLVGCIGWIRRSDSSNVFVYDLLRCWAEDVAFSTRRRLGIT